MKVLIAEDDEDFSVVSRTILESDGHRVESVVDGEQALARIRQAPPDVVLSDILMPGLDGFGLCRALRSDPLLRDIPIVLYSANYNDVEDRVLANNLGATRFLAKPATPRQLLEVLNQAAASGAWHTPDYREQLSHTEAHLRRINNKLSEKVRELEKERESMRLAAAVIENTGDGVMVIDRHLRIIQVNPAFVSTTGYSAQEAVGQTLDLLKSGHHDDDFYAVMWQKLKSQGHWRGEIWSRRKDGDVYPEWLRISTIRNGEREVSHYIGIFSDIGSQPQFKERLHYLAYYDGLTQLPNRRLLMDRIANTLPMMARSESRAAVLFMDLDGFKGINDSLGHAQGDALLHAVARKLDGCVRASDTAARLGGDEFVVLLTELVTADQAGQVAEKILQRMSEPITLQEHTLEVSVSIGISVFPEDGGDAEVLLEKADVAMYRAKKAGRNGYRFYQTGQDAIGELEGDT